ncbi:MAG: hypothetical protein ACK4GN_02480 [Runella sp.]
MPTLSHDWLTENWIDFEYKKYLLLAYLQGVKKNFADSKLFPDLPEVRLHYGIASQVKQSKQQMAAAFPKKIKKIDWEKMRLVFEKFSEDSILQEIDMILDYALPLFQQTLAQGQEQYDDIEAKLTFSPVGIVPLHLHEGYLFIYRTQVRQAEVYQYQVKIFDKTEERRVHTTYLQTIHKNVAMTFEGIKINLVRQRRELPNPATYLVESPRDYPVQETLLPIAKKMLVNQVA